MTQAGLRGLQMSRTRGALSGLLLMLLGVWGALAPFVGPRFGFAYTPDHAWTWTAARGWLEVLPGAATALGGLVLLLSANRATAMLGGWITVLGGAWFVVGRHLAPLLRIGDIGNPVAATQARRVLIELAYFSGLGAVIVFLAAVVMGRVSTPVLRGAAAVRAPTPPPASAPVKVRSAAPPNPPPRNLGEPERFAAFRRNRRARLGL